MQNKKNLYIIGADGLARELESWLVISDKAITKWNFKGFLYDLKDYNPLNGFPSDYKILGDWSSFKFKPSDEVLIGVANPSWRERIYNDLKNRGVRIASFVAHNTVIGKFTEISEGTIICPSCIISTNVRLGKACFINGGSQVGHDVAIGSYTSIMAQVAIGGFCKIKEKVLIGSNVTILPKREIASNTTIGAGSVVLRNIKKEGVSVFGNPAQQI